MCFVRPQLTGFLFATQRDARAGCSHKANQVLGITSLSFHFLIWDPGRNNSTYLTAVVTIMKGHKMGANCCAYSWYHWRPCSSVLGPWTSSISITRELVRTAVLNSTPGLLELHINKILRGFICTLRLKKHRFKRSHKQFSGQAAY